MSTEQNLSRSKLFNLIQKMIRDDLLKTQFLYPPLKNHVRSGTPYMDINGTAFSGLVAVVIIDLSLLLVFIRAVFDFD